MKIYIITHKYSTTLKKCLARYKELGYNPIIYNGLNITEDKIEKSKVCYLNYLKLLENDDCADDDIIISEDDVYLNEKIEIKNRDELNWLGWWRYNNNELLGSMVIYIPQKLIPHVRRQFKAKDPCHLDYFLRSYLDFIVRPETICKEISHKSLIVDKVRKHRHILR